MPSRAVMLNGVALFIDRAVCPYPGKPHFPHPQLYLKPQLEPIQLFLHRLQRSFHFVVDDLLERSDEGSAFLLIHFQLGEPPLQLTDVITHTPVVESLTAPKYLSARNARQFICQRLT